MPFARRLQRAIVAHRRALALLGAVGATALGAGIWLREEWRRRAVHPRLTVVVCDTGGNALPDARGSVALRPIDPLSGEVGPPQSLGKLPLRQQRVSPGLCRLVVELEAGGTIECTRDLPGDGQELALEVTQRPPDDVARRRMVRLPGTTWQNPQTETTCPNRERPVRLEPFLLDVTEVSNAQYREFLIATRRPPPAAWQGQSWQEPGARLARGDGPSVSFDDLPVVGISWADALAYAEWCGLRLPTHAEWEWAARGAENRAYPWGEQPAGATLRGATNGPASDQYATVAEGFRIYLDHAAPVHSHADAATPEGLLHMLGNVAEFTETPCVQVGASAAEPRYRYAMGHAWDVAWYRASLASAHRPTTIGPDGCAPNLGFRCARTVHP